MIGWFLILMLNNLKRDELIKSSKHPCVAVVAIQIMVGVYTTLLLRRYY